MIRWYDYVVVFFYADFMMAWLFLGFTATEWYMPLVSGFIVGFLWRSWNDFYCKFRLHQEIKNGQ